MALLLKAIALTLFLKITKSCVVCNNTYMMKMLKPANVLDFVDYTTVYNIKLAFAHYFGCQIIHDSISLMFESGQISTRQP